MAISRQRREQVELSRALRDEGSSWPTIASTLRTHYGLNGRVAMRLARGWSQADAAAQWNRRWPDDPKTFKSISYWENWPGRTGHAPSLIVLDRLARMYECDVADLVAGWGEHRSDREPDEPHDADERALIWRIQHLGLHQLTRALTDVASRWPPRRRGALLLKLGTAASLAATSSTTNPWPTSTVGALDALEGRWTSVYGYHSTSRTLDLEGMHEIVLRAERGRLRGRSDPHPDGSELDLVLSIDGNLATGRWTERTSPHGHYRAATYHGVVQFVVEPTGRSMDGRWLGVSKRFTIKSGRWTLRWSGPAPNP
ncbi:helix-turn-helix transcriptional regulator [Pseudonocardia sp.]|uniref:helix-turn-helix transcriptional regulator n=1 Tax=Pseudonocardia sp. TaxID=60912 RepID=UPI003D0E2A5A